MRPGSPGSRPLLLILAFLGLAVGGGPPAPTRSATLAPAGTELYGYLPYWEMTPAVVDYLADVPLTDLELFSVAAASNGGLRRSETGYRRITGEIGARVIAEAHARGQRVELVFSSFDFDPNDVLFGRATLGPLDDSRGIRRPATPAGGVVSGWRRTSSELVALAKRLGVDGIDVDVEQIRGDAYEGYAAFVTNLRGRLDAEIPGARLTVATMANLSGANLARAAITAGVDRVFLMGYEYHWSGSTPGASAPITRGDGGLSLASSIATYAAVGVPPGKTILGLPLFGMSWTVGRPSPYAPRLASGVHWIPSNHVAQLTAPGFETWFSSLETVEFVAEPITPKASPDASAPPPAPDASAPPPAPTWQGIFYDSPRTLRPKLVLAVANGYAGAGFWAIGYERGLPGYIELMADFRAGRLTTAPPVSLEDR